MPIQMPAVFLHAEFVGTRLRPDSLLAASCDHAQRSVSVAALRGLENEAIRDTVAEAGRAGKRH